MFDILPICMYEMNASGEIPSLPFVYIECAETSTDSLPCGLETCIPDTVILARRFAFLKPTLQV